MNKWAMRIIIVIALSNLLSIIAHAQTTVISDIRLIDGNGRPPVQTVDMVIKADRISAVIAHGTDKFPNNVKIISMSGKTIIPAMINAHGHLGLLKGPTGSAKEISPKKMFNAS